MDNHTQETDAPVASAKATDETAASAVNDRDTLQGLLQNYFDKHTELQALARNNSMARIGIRLDSRTLDLDNLSTLGPYNDLLASSQKCLAHQVDYNARERVIYAKLKDIMALEAEIMANYPSELESVGVHTRVTFEAKMKFTSGLRIECLRNYWEDISRRPKLRSESIHRKIFAFDPLRSLSTIPTISSRSPAFLDTLSTAMNTHDLTDGDTGSATSSTHDLSTRMTGAENQTNLNLGDNTLHQPTSMSSEAKKIRCTEIKEQIMKLEQEILANTVECSRQFCQFDKYNRRYLRLRKRMGDMAQPVILDTNNESRLRKANILLTLDLDRVKAFSAATKGLRREFEIVEEIKELFVEMAGLKGVVETPEYQEALDDIHAKIETQHETRRIIGRHLLELVRGRGGN
ncbi:hypothetical protein M436DRAFT_61777 [Aureobasidium namibiae CBS 147.97]|uniref:Uncharacterized protein n=1 Tax=Aureobasidium namibiae CBS 147.97 TaxID=1043004 RepID=A0A074WQB8_9PEZI